MRSPSAILRSLSSRRIQPRATTAAVAPLPATTRFNHELTAELDTLHSQCNIGDGELGLAQLLDATITTQRIALDSLVNVAYKDDVDRGTLEEYLVNNIDVLDACNYFVERIEDMKKYVDTLLRVVALVRLVDDSGGSVAIIALALKFLESCHDIEKKHCMGKRGLCLRRVLRQKKLGHDVDDETEFSEILCGSKAMALMGCRFLELGLSFEYATTSGIPKMKKQCQCHYPTCSFSWMRLLQEVTEQTEGITISAADEKGLHKRGSGSLMMQTVSAARELKDQLKGKREKEMIRYVVERLQRSCKELDDGLGSIEGRVKELYRSLIDVRMALLGILSQE